MKLPLLFTWLVLVAVTVGLGADTQSTLARALNSACIDGKTKDIEKLLAQGADPNQASDVFQLSPLPLHEAIGHHHLEAVKILIRAGARLNGTQPSALVTAIRENYPPVEEKARLEMIDLLLSRGADLHANDDEATHVAGRETLGVLKHLIKAGGKPSFLTLASAVDRENLENLNYLVDAGIDPKSRDNEGATLLHRAVEANSWSFGGKPGQPEKMWARLLELGISVDATDKAGNSALHLAARIYFLKMATWLIDHHGSADIENLQGITPMALAAGSEDDDEVEKFLKLLMHAGARIGHTDHSGRSPLDHALTSENWTALKTLLEAGAKPSDAHAMLAAFARATLDHGTSLKNAVPLVRQLAPQVRDVKHAKVDGMPFLSWAVLINNQAVAHWLVQAGAGLDLTDKAGRTPLVIATMTGNKEMERFLRDAGARTNNKKRSTPIKPTTDGRSDRSFSAAPAQPDDLFAAIAQGSLDDVKRITAVRSFAVHEMRGGVLPLHLALSLGHRDVADWLLLHGGSETTTTADGEAPVIVAIKSGHSELARWLVRRASPVQRAEIVSALASLWKAKRQSYQALKLLVEEQGINAIAREDDSKALNLTITAGDLGLTKGLLDRGAKLKVLPVESNDPFGPGSSEENPLKLAVQSGHTDMLKLVIERIGAERSAWEEPINQALMLSCSAGDLAAVRLLVESAGANVNVESKSFDGVGGGAVYGFGYGNMPFTPICQAVEGGHRQVVEYLFAKGAKATGRDRTTRQVLASAVCTGDPTLVRLMIDHGAALEAADRDKRTALHEAAARGLRDIGRLLISRGSNQEARDSDGLTPSELAEHEGYLPP